MWNSDYVEEKHLHKGEKKLVISLGFGKTKIIQAFFSQAYANSYSILIVLVFSTSHYRKK